MADTRLIADLQASRHLLTQTGWTQGAYARGRSGISVPTLDPSATCFCALGAVDRSTATYQNFEAAVAALNRALGDPNAKASAVMLFNDAVGRTEREVIGLFTKAIEMEQARD